MKDSLLFKFFNYFIHYINI